LYSISFSSLTVILLTLNLIIHFLDIFIQLSDMTREYRFILNIPKCLESGDKSKPVQDSHSLSFDYTYLICIFRLRGKFHNFLFWVSPHFTAEEHTQKIKHINTDALK